MAFKKTRVDKNGKRTTTTGGTKTVTEEEFKSNGKFTKTRGYIGVGRNHKSSSTSSRGVSKRRSKLY